MIEKVQKIKDNIYLKYFSLKNVPLLFFLGPKIEKLNETECVVKIPLRTRSKNHLGSMYFAALAAGADCAAGFLAMKLIENSPKKVSLSFKEFHAEFLKRAEGDTLFSCLQGEEITAFVGKVLESRERQHMNVHVIATCPEKLGSVPVAKFSLTLSLKVKS